MRTRCMYCWNLNRFITIYKSIYKSIYKFILFRIHVNTEIILNLTVLNIFGYSPRKDE